MGYEWIAKLLLSRVGIHLGDDGLLDVLGIWVVLRVRDIWELCTRPLRFQDLGSIIEPTRSSGLEASELLPGYGGSFTD